MTKMRTKPLTPQVAPIQTGSQQASQVAVVQPQSPQAAAKTANPTANPPTGRQAGAVASATVTAAVTSLPPITPKRDTSSARCRSGAIDISVQKLLELAPGNLHLNLIEEA